VRIDTNNGKRNSRREQSKDGYPKQLPSALKKRRLTVLFLIQLDHRGILNGQSGRPCASERG
jgi:hypothetical protein